MSLKIEMLQKWKCREMKESLKKCHYNENVTKMEMLLKWKYHSNEKITKMEITLKLNC